VLLEKALTGLDLGSEQQLVKGGSVVVPPPIEQLPLLERPLVSGLDAVVVLDCEGEEEEVAVQRSLGRRLDPQTGESLSHLLQQKEGTWPIPTTTVSLMSFSTSLTK
jgi:hypothetical protein